MIKTAIKLISMLLLLGIVFMAGRMSAFSAAAIKGLAIATIVEKNATSIDKTVNNLLKKNGVTETAATKVVPIISVGKGSYVGAAQVSGSKQNIDQVEAVIQLETTLGKTFRINVYIPADRKALLNYKRINGVGTSAVIDVKL